MHLMYQKYLQGLSNQKNLEFRLPQRRIYVSELPGLQKTSSVTHRYRIGNFMAKKKFRPLAMYIEILAII
jgi:hypothetical protein